MKQRFAVRIFFIALMLVAASAASSYAATTTGAVLIPGITDEFPQPIAPTVVKPRVVVPVTHALPKPVHTVVSFASKNRVLSRGMSGTDVKALQVRLVTLSLLKPEFATGFFGAITESAVKTFQTEYSIASFGSAQTTGFGSIGARTRLALQNAVPTTITSSASESSHIPAVTGAGSAQTPFTTNTTAQTQSVPSSTIVPAQSQGNVSAGVACSFNGQSIASGATFTAYQSPAISAVSPQCVSETRACTNGVLSGSYLYATCASQAAQSNAPSDTSATAAAIPAASVNTPPPADPLISCVWNSAPVNSGASVSAFQTANVPFGSVCQSESRTCTNGSLTGSFAFPSCQVGAAAACTFNGQVIASGASVSAFQSSLVAAGNSCVSQKRSCLNGVLSGAYQYASCSVSSASVPPPATCSLNGQTIMTGGSVTAYQSNTVPYGTSCVSQQRVCSNGQFSGSYTYASCQVASPATCTFNGSVVDHGASVTAYQAASVAVGGTCVSQTRTCSNGTLSGTYTFAACTVAVPASCTFNGQTIASGSSVAAFQNTVVGSGSSCSSQTRTCTNGVLSGSSSYTYDHCSVQSNSVPLPNVFIPVLYNGTNIQLHAWYATPGGAGPFPVIILAHGCSGITPDSPDGLWSQMDSWGATIRGWGYATLIVDSFTARGISDGICDTGSLSTPDRSLDIYAAATILAKTANVNPQKIGVFGVSHGANTVSWATRNESYTNAARATLTAAGGKISAGASLYPNCDTAFGATTYYSPFFTAIGSADDWANHAVCESLTNYPTVSGVPVEVSGFGALVRMTVYPNVTHSFDIPGSTTTHAVLGHSVAYNPTVTADVQSRIRVFFDLFLK